MPIQDLIDAAKKKQQMNMPNLFGIPEGGIPTAPDKFAERQAALPKLGSQFAPSGGYGLIPQSEVPIPSDRNSSFGGGSASGSQFPLVESMGAPNQSGQLPAVNPSRGITAPAGGITAPPAGSGGQSTPAEGEISFRMPDGTMKTIAPNESIQGAFGKPDDGMTTMNIDGGSISVPRGMEAQTLGLDQGTQGASQPPALSAPTQAQPASAPQPQSTPQQDFNRRMASGEPLSREEIAQAERFAQSMGYRFDPNIGYVQPGNSVEDFAEVARSRGLTDDGQISAFATQAANAAQSDAQANAVAQTGDKTPERERRVDSLVNTMGLSQSQALGIVEGVNRIVQDPTTGDTMMLNIATGESEPIDISPDAQQQFEGAQASQTEPSQSLYEMSKKSTGIFPSLKVLGQGIAGQVGLEFGDAPEIIGMRQNVATAQQQLIRALSINPRFPVSEQERIKKEINISPGAWLDPVSIDAKMKAVDSALQDRLEDEIQAHQNKSLPRTTRQAALQAANDISNFLSLLGVPEDGEGDAADIPSGIDASDWQYMTPEQKKLFNTK